MTAYSGRNARDGVGGADCGTIVGCASSPSLAPRHPHVPRHATVSCVPSHARDCSTPAPASCTRASAVCSTMTARTASMAPGMWATARSVAAASKATHTQRTNSKTTAMSRLGYQHHRSAQLLQETFHRQRQAILAVAVSCLCSCSKPTTLLASPVSITRCCALSATTHEMHEAPTTPARSLAEPLRTVAQCQVKQRRHGRCGCKGVAPVR